MQENSCGRSKSAVPSATTSALFPCHETERRGRGKHAWNSHIVRLAAVGSSCEDKGQKRRRRVDIIVSFADQIESRLDTAAITPNVLRRDAHSSHCTPLSWSTVRCRGWVSRLTRAHAPPGCGQERSGDGDLLCHARNPGLCVSHEGKDASSSHFEIPLYAVLSIEAQSLIVVGFEALGTKTSGRRRRRGRTTAHGRLGNQSAQKEKYPEFYKRGQGEGRHIRFVGVKAARPFAVKGVAVAQVDELACSPTKRRGGGGSVGSGLRLDISPVKREASERVGG